MSTFNKTKLASAIAAASCAVVAGQASAVYVNDGGLGEALIYPYYTVRGDNATLMSVVNTTGQAKVVKVRFREGKNTADVLDFNLFLSAYDVWTGAILNTNDRGNGTGGAMLVSRDTSCTTPTRDEDGNTFATGIPFRSFDYTSLNKDAQDQTVDRVREGYIEVIEFATIPNGSALGKDVTHGSSGPRTPACKIVPTLNRLNAANAGRDEEQFANLAPPTGGLFGSVTFLNGTAGTNTGVDAVALNSFWGDIANTEYFDAADDKPNLGSGQGRSVVVNGSSVYISDWSETPAPSSGFKATTAVLMRASVINEYAYTDDKVFSTDWVITMPNKRYFVNNAATDGTWSGGTVGVGVFTPTPARAPFQRIFGASGSCDTIAISSYDREEGGKTSAPGTFSPVRPGAASDALCWESNVISFGKAAAASEPSRVLGSTNNLWFAGYQNNGAAVPSVNAATQGEGGWAKLTFVTTTTSSVHQLINTVGPIGVANTVFNGTTVRTGVASVTYVGLPVVGFAVVQANQGTKASFASSYGHRFERIVR
ncbi:MAG: hypothetical protein EAZ30_03295 [Betaproteobacteria bacterium]|nr:MAG: hypothetical protein EAZ30_03295 [Betaproteobacteria bacterium]